MSEDEIDLPKPKGPFIDRQFSKRAPGQIGIDFADRREVIGAQCPWPEWPATEKVGKVCGLPADPRRKGGWCRHHYRLVYPRL